MFAALDAKYAKVIYSKLKMILYVMMLPLVVVGCTSKRSVSQCVKPPPPPAWITIQPPRLADAAERDYFTLRRLITMQKQLEGTQYINERIADRVAHIDGQLMQLLANNTHALPAEYKCLK